MSLPWKQIGNFSGFEHCNKNLGSFKANVFNWWPFNILILAFSVLLYIWSFFFNCEKLFTSCLTHLNPQHCRSDLGDVRMTASLREITKVWLFFGHFKCGSDVSLKGGSVSLLMWGNFHSWWKRRIRTWTMLNAACLQKRKAIDRRRNENLEGFNLKVLFGPFSWTNVYHTSYQ